MEVDISQIQIKAQIRNYKKINFGGSTYAKYKNTQSN